MSSLYRPFSHICSNASARSLQLRSRARESATKKKKKKTKTKTKTKGLQRRGEPTANLLKVLEFEELVASVAGHVDEHVAALVGHQSLGPRHALVVPAFRRRACMVSE
jgi:hypothetical protein